MAITTMSQLLESGVHFGHQTKNWNPKMKPYILTKKNGIHIIDLRQTVDMLNEIYADVKELVANGGNVLFVGTKPQASKIIEEHAIRIGMPFVSHRWLGGMLTNFPTIQKRVKRLKELSQLDFTNPGTLGLTKKEVLLLEREYNKLNKSLGGIQNMVKPPSAIWVVDVLKEKNAVTEAHRLGIKVYGIIDTNVDPSVVDVPVVGNDDASNSIGILTTIVADAVADGLVARNEKAVKKLEQGKADDDAPVEEAQPLAQWEKDLLDVPELEVDASKITSSSDISQSAVKDEEVSKFNEKEMKEEK